MSQVPVSVVWDSDYFDENTIVFVLFEAYGMWITSQSEDYSLSRGSWVSELQVSLRIIGHSLGDGFLKYRSV